MTKNIVKIVMILVITITSFQVSTHFINNYVLEVEAKEKTIADAIIYNQIQQSLKEAEKKIEEAQIAENIVIETEKVEMKPPVVQEKPAEDILAEKIDEEEPPIDTADSIESTEESVNSGDDFVNLETLQNLTEEDIKLIGRYLVDNYFLDGYVYYNNETDPVRYKKKKQAYEMESHVINSLNLFVDKGQTADIIEEVSALSAKFKEEYQNVTEPEFVEIYDHISAYFYRYIDVLDKLKIFKETLENSSNQALTATVAFASLKNDIIPGMKDILNTGFDLKEKTNAIYLEGVEGVKLLSKEEVKAIIKNPDFIIFEKSE